MKIFLIYFSVCYNYLKGKIDKSKTNEWKIHKDKMQR